MHWHDTKIMIVGWSALIFKIIVTPLFFTATFVTPGTVDGAGSFLSSNNKQHRLAFGGGVGGLLSRRDLLLEQLFYTTTTTTTTLVSSSSSSMLSSSSVSSSAAAMEDNKNNEASSKIIHWGIVGLGDVCQKKSGPGFYKCRGSQLVAVMRRTPGAAEEWAKTNVPANNNCKGYDNLEEFLRDDRLDAVYISTRPGTHLEICRMVVEAAAAAAGNGIKAVYVEKPVGRCAAEAQQMEEICKAANVNLYTAYISRAYDRTESIRQLIREGVVGDHITDIRYNLVGLGGARDMDSTSSLPWRLDAEQSGGGLIMDVGCHVIDRIDYLFGPLLNVKGEAKNKSNKQPVEDYVHFVATIGGRTSSKQQQQPTTTIRCVGAKVSCTWDFSGQQQQQQGDVDEFVISGPKGSLRMAGMTPSGPIDVLDSNGKLVRTIDQFTMPEHTAQNLIQAITDDLLLLRSGGGGDHHSTTSSNSHCLSRIDNALRAQKVLDEALSSYYGGREIGFWDRPQSWPGRQKT